MYTSESYGASNMLGIIIIIIIINDSFIVIHRMDIHFELRRGAYKHI